jgi:hypothetical protein
MKKRNNKIFALIFLSFLLINIFAIAIISAAEDTTQVAINWFKESYQKYVRPPMDIMNAANLGNASEIFDIVTLIGLIVFITIVFDISTFLPFSTPTNIIIGSGSLIVLILIGFIRWLIGVSMSLIILGAGIAGIIGMVGAAVLFVVAAVAVVWGSQTAHEMLDKIKYNRESLKKRRKAYEAAANVEALNLEARNVFKDHGLFGRFKS